MCLPRDSLQSTSHFFVAEAHYFKAGFSTGKLGPFEPSKLDSMLSGYMLHVIEMWNTTSSDLHHMKCNEWAMIRCICSVTNKDQASSQDMLRMQLDLYDMAMWNTVMVGSRKSINSNRFEVAAVVALRKPEQS